MCAVCTHIRVRVSYDNMMIKIIILFHIVLIYHLGIHIFIIKSYDNNMMIKTIIDNVILDHISIQSSL